MEDNPYQSPLTPPAKRRAVTFTVLTLLSIPAAAIAGSGICSASAAITPARFWDSGTIEILVLGFATIGVFSNLVLLTLLHHHFLRPYSRNYLTAAILIIFATPFAIMAAFGLGAVVIGNTIMLPSPSLKPEWPAVAGLFVVGIVAQGVWGAAYWLGLAWPQHKD